MEHKILESIGVENENVDGAALNHFFAGRKSGVIRGILNECTVYASSSSTVEVSSGELLIHGFRVKILSPYSFQRSASASMIQHHIVARISLSADRSVSFTLECRVVAPLAQDPLFVTESGTYEIEIARFSTGTSGISNLTRTVQDL